MKIQDLFEQPVLRPAPPRPGTPAKPAGPARPGSSGEVIPFPAGKPQSGTPPSFPGRAPGEIITDPSKPVPRPGISDLLPGSPMRDLLDPLRPPASIIPKPPAERGTGPTISLPRSTPSREPGVSDSSDDLSPATRQSVTDRSPVTRPTRDDPYNPEPVITPVVRPTRPIIPAPSTPELQPERRPVTAPSTPELQPERRPVTAPTTPELQPERRPPDEPVITPVTRPTRDDPYNPEPVITPVSGSAAITRSIRTSASALPAEPSAPKPATASSPPPVKPPDGERLAAPPPTVPSTDAQPSQLSTVSKPSSPRTAAPSRDTSVQQLSPPGVSDDSRINAMRYLAGLKASGGGETLTPALGLNPTAWPEPQLRSGFRQQTGRDISDFPPSGRDTGVRESLNRLARLAGLHKK